MTMQTAMQRLIDVQEVIRLTTLSQATIYRRIEREGDDFPRPVKLNGSRRIMWVEAEVQGWIAAQIESARRAS
jgi:predicted DNA-binding transcriptional regulator AlpA